MWIRVCMYWYYFCRYNLYSITCLNLDTQLPPRLANRGGIISFHLDYPVAGPICGQRWMMKVWKSPRLTQKWRDNLAPWVLNVEPCPLDLRWCIFWSSLCSEGQDTPWSLVSYSNFSHHSPGAHPCAPLHTASKPALCWVWWRFTAFLLGPQKSPGIPLQARVPGIPFETARDFIRIELIAVADAHHIAPETLGKTAKRVINIRLIIRNWYISWQKYLNVFDIIYRY